MTSSLPHGIRVALADDHVLVRCGVKALLDSIPGMDVVAEAGDGSELLQKLERTPADVVLMDLNMPGMDGLAAIACVRRQHPAIRILVLSMDESPEAVRLTAAAGACGYLTKLASDSELEQAVRTVKATGSYFSPAVSLGLVRWTQRQPAHDLTDRQREVLILLANGMSAKAIGSELGLAPRTIDVHRARIMKRLELTSMASLTRYAVRTGLVAP